MARHLFWSVTPEFTNSPYVAELVGELRGRGWTIDHLSLRSILRTRRQIVHVQWPEHVSRGATPAATAIKHLRAVALHGALRLRNHDVVLTAHNRVPHGDHDAVDGWFRRALFDRAQAIVVLVPDHEAEIRELESIGPETTFVFAPLPMLETTPRPIVGPDQLAPLLMLGQIHPYHLIEEFLSALADVGNERPVIVAGAVGDEALADRLDSMAAVHAWIEVRRGHQPDDVVDELTGRCAAVVSLQQKPFNSGAGPFALPRHVPLAMSDSAQTRMLQRAAGPEWVLPLPADLGTLTLASLESWLAMGRTAPDLSAFSLSRVADAHEELYNSMPSGRSS